MSQDEISDIKVTDRIQSPSLRLSRYSYIDITSTNKLNKVIEEGNYIKELKYVNDGVCSNCSRPSAFLYPLKFQYIVESFKCNILDEESKKIQNAVLREEAELKTMNKGEILKR